MTYEEKVSWLSRYRGKLLEINDMMERIVRQNAQAERMTANLSPAGGGGSGIGDNLQLCVASICELEERQAKAIAEGMRFLLEIEDVIAELPDELWRVVLRRKYIDGQSLNKMAEALNYSEKHIKRFHNRAIIALKL
jgi:DNA-directed RNA polymerase specialized sigma24 family protein